MVEVGCSVCGNSDSEELLALHGSAYHFLEIGSNTGGLLVAARAKGWSVKGVDTSIAACQFAREHFDLDVYAGTLQSAQFPDNYFDVIFSNATLEHVRDLFPMMQECARILRPGGIFYADTVNWDSYTREILDEDWKLIHPTHHVHLFTPRNIVTLCERSGLSHIKTWTSGVRVKANAKNPTFKTPWYLNLMKGPLSALTRIIQKGDSIEFLAMKP